MIKKRKRLPGADHIDDLAQSVDEDWHRSLGLEAGAVGLFTRIWVLARLETAFYERLLKGSGRNATEHYVLGTLRAQGPSTPTELNRTLIQTSGGVTNTLARLERAGLILRRRVGQDRRSVRVTLTPLGRREVDRTMAIVGPGIEARAKKLSATQRERANRALDDLIATLLD